MNSSTDEAVRGRLPGLMRGIGALIVLIAIVVGIPVLMVGLHMVPHGIPSLHQLGQDLRRRDNGQIAAVVIAAGVWICWALFTLSLIPEIAAAARKRRSHPLPGLAVFQRPAGALIAAIVIGFTIAPMITGVSATRADAASPLPRPRPATTVLTAPADTATRAATPAESAPTKTYQVRHRDTLWGIAEDHLGDPMRYTEIVQLNPHTVAADNEIITGSVLRMPADAVGLPSGGTDSPSAAAKTVEVQVGSGDSLWSIEQWATGNGTNWQTGWDANRGRAEPGGEHFDNPDLIKPGWVLSIPVGPAVVTPTVATAPTRTPRTPTVTTTPRTAPHDEPATPARLAAPSSPTNPATSSALPASTPTSHAPTRPTADRSEGSAESRYAALEVGGGLLAATTLTALMIYRRRKFRHRRPGRTVASLPPELLPLEQALVSRGRPALAKMTFLDLALRDLAERIASAPGGVLPDVVGAGINDDYLELYLAGESAQPPEPWLVVDSLRWALSRDADLDRGAARRLAPYPCLASVGCSEDGTEYLLDLEHVGALQLTGDPVRCLELARYMVAELANNAWSDHLTVTVAGFARELVAANPSRVAYTDDLRSASSSVARIAAENLAVAGEAGVDVLEGRLRGTDADVWMPHVLLTAQDALGEQDAEDDLLPIAVGGGRSAVAMVLTGLRDVDERAGRIEVTSAGALVTSLLPVSDVAAFGLPLADAADIARAIALHRVGTLDEPMPRSTGSCPWDVFTDRAGALLPEYTQPRAAGRSTNIDPTVLPGSSLLLAPDEAYLDVTATTEEDLADLAPMVTTQTRGRVEWADPELDELVEAWNAPDSKLAKLQVLGPVRVTAVGRPPVKQEDFCTEIVAYLWGKPNGVSTDQYANDLWPRKNYTGTDSYPKDMASRVRHWLGTDPRTGTEYWPRARRGGVAGYRIDGLLVDYDLFRRLRVRGEARGADGLGDLVAALHLVSGTPLSRLREFGYGWLPIGDELMYQGAIAEVSHLVATRALEAGDDAEAIRACETALHVDAADDRALLTLAKAHENAGREAEKEATILRLKTLDDPPTRTLEVMRRNGWLVRGA